MRRLFGNGRINAFACGCLMFPLLDSLVKMDVVFLPNLVFMTGNAMFWYFASSDDRV